MNFKKYKQAVADYCSNNKSLIFGEVANDFDDLDYDIICSREEWEVQKYSLEKINMGIATEIALYCPYHDDRFEAILKLKGEEVSAIELNISY